MRYVNLKKKNRSKFHILTKRVASVSLVGLAFLALIVIPLANRSNDLQVNDQNQVQNISEFDLGNDQLDVLNESLDNENL